MKLLLLTFILLIDFASFSQDYDRAIPWPVGDIEGKVICDDPKNGIVIAGYSGSHGLLYSVDTLGNVLWKKSLLFAQPEYYAIQFFDLIATSDSGFVAVGNYINDTTLQKEGILIKFTKNGDLVWNQLLKGGPSVEFNNAALSEMADSSYLLAWGSSSSGDGLSISKFDTNGASIWSKGYSFASPATVSALKAISDSTFILGGDVHFGNGDNGLLAQISDTGAINWARSYIDLKIEDVLVDSSELFLAGYRTIDSKRFVTSSSFSNNFNWMTSTSTDEYETMGATSSLIKIADTMLLNFSPNAADVSLATKVHTNGTVAASYELYMFKNDLMPTNNGGALFLGHGPVHGIKSLYLYHIGMIQRDSLFANGTCFWSTLVDTSTMSFPNPNSLAPITAAAPDIFQHPITDGPVELEFYDGCVFYIGGLDENAIQSFVSVYPNLSDGKFHFDVSILEAVDLRIYSSAGILLLEEKGIIESTTVDLTRYADGAYYYQVSTPDGLSNSGTLILQK